MVQVTQLKSESEDATKSKAAMKIIAGLHTKIKVIQSEKKVSDADTKKVRFTFCFSSYL